MSHIIACFCCFFIETIFAMYMMVISSIYDCRILLTWHSMNLMVKNHCFLIFVYHFLENVISECHGNSSYKTKPYPQQTNLSHNVDNSLYVCSYLVHSMHDATNFLVLDLPLPEIVSFTTNDNCARDQNTSLPFYYLENQQANKTLHYQSIVQLIV